MAAVEGTGDSDGSVQRGLKRPRAGRVGQRRCDAPCPHAGGFCAHTAVIIQHWVQ